MDIRSWMGSLLGTGVPETRGALIRADQGQLSDLPMAGEALSEYRAAIQSAAGQRLAPFLTQTPIYHPGNFRNIVRYAYRGNELVHSAIKLIINIFGQARLEVENEDGEQIPNHPLRRLIKKPWRDSYENHLWEWTLTDMYLAGNAFWEKVRSRTGKVVGIIRLEPDRVGIMPNQINEVDHFLYEVGGQWYPVPREDVVHWKFHNPGLGDPLDHFFGLAPLIAAWRAIQTDNEMTDFTKVVLQNYAVPGAVIEAEQSIDEKDAKDIKRKFKEAAGGRNRGEAFVAQKGMKVKTIGMTLEQLSFESIRGISETRILMILGGAPLVYLLGTSAGMKRAIYNNYSEAREALADDVVGPLWNRVDDAISAFLLPEFDQSESHFAVFDTSDVIAFEERRMRRIQQVTAAVTTGLMTRDEGRLLIKKKALGKNGKDELYVPVNVDRVLVSDGEIDEDEEFADPEPEEPNPEDTTPQNDRGKPAKNPNADPTKPDSKKKTPPKEKL